MAWLIRSLRAAPPSEVTLTALAGSVDDPRGEKALGKWFEAFDIRGLAVTWGMIGAEGDWSLASQMIQSAVPHELAYRISTARLGDSLPLLESQSAVAHQVDIPLRTMIRAGCGIHPGVLARLGVNALVRLDELGQKRQSGFLRSYGWNQWEVLITDLVPASLGLTESTQLLARLMVAKRDDAQLHLLWDLTKLAKCPRTPTLRLLDGMAELVRRNHISVSTLGHQAQLASQRSGLSAA